METKKIRVELDKVKVVRVMIDLGNDLANYQSRFLMLKNHERETKAILEVRNFYGSNNVCITFLIEDENDEAKEVEHCKEWSEQFGTIKEPEVDTAYILDKDYNGINDQLDYNELFIYD